MDIFNEKTSTNYKNTYFETDAMKAEISET